MKKGIIIACLALFSMVSCSNNAKTEEKQPVKVVNASKITTEATTEPITTVEITTEAEILAATEPETTGVVLHEDDNCTITYNGFDNSEKTQDIYLTIDNKTDNSLTVALSELKINSISIDQFYKPQLKAKNSVSKSIHIMNNTLQNENITRVNDIEMKMQITVTDKTNGDCLAYYDTDTMTITR